MVMIGRTTIHPVRHILSSPCGDTQAYYFLNDYDPYSGSVGQLRYSTPAHNMAVPTYMAAYSTPPSYNTPAYHQSTGNGSAIFWLNEANVSYLAGSYQQAAESYARAVDLDSSLSQGWLNLGNSLYFLGRYQASLNAYDAVLGSDPQNANAFAGKSQALLALNNTRRPNNPTMIPSPVQ